PARHVEVEGRVARTAHSGNDLGGVARSDELRRPDEGDRTMDVDVRRGAQIRAGQDDGRRSRARTYPGHSRRIAISNDRHDGGRAGAPYQQAGVQGQLVALGVDAEYGEVQGLANLYVRIRRIYD